MRFPPSLLSLGSNLRAAVNGSSQRDILYDVSNAAMNTRRERTRRGSLFNTVRTASGKFIR